jgi:hypothetical protein
MTFLTLVVEASIRIDGGPEVSRAQLLLKDLGGGKSSHTVVGSCQQPDQKAQRGCAAKALHSLNT